jgi:uncharacterized membrane protein
MDPALGVAVLALLFVGTHVGLATTAIRGRLTGALGEVGYVVVYTLVASGTLAAVLGYYAAHRFEGVAGLAAGAHPAAHALLLAVIGAGVALMVAGLAGYPRMPMALFGQAISEPYGIERVTRHPFFAGIAMLGLAHVLLAPRLAGAVLMGSLALLAIAGARHQDAKHLRRRGRPYADYLAVTSTLPFAAIVAGRQRLVWRELPLGTLAAGVGAAVALRAVHDGLFADGGRWIVAAAVVGGGVAGLQSWLRARRPSARGTLPPRERTRAGARG